MTDEKETEPQEEIEENREQDNSIPVSQVTPELSPENEKLKAEAEKLRFEGIKAQAETHKINIEKKQLEKYFFQTNSFLHSFVIASLAAVVALAAAVGAFVIGQQQININNEDQKVKANQAIANASPANSNVSVANSIETAGVQIANALGTVDLGGLARGASAAPDQGLNITGIPSTINIGGIPPNINIAGIPTPIPFALPKGEPETSPSPLQTDPNVFEPTLFIRTFLSNNPDGQKEFNDALTKYVTAKNALNTGTNSTNSSKVVNIQNLERSVSEALADLLLVMVGFTDNAKWKSDLFNILNTKLYERDLSSTPCYVNLNLLITTNKSLRFLDQIQLNSMKDQAEKFIEVCRSQPSLPGDEDNLTKIELLLAKIRVELLTPFKNLG
ncbi:MAG TPA: hypothetical protein VGO50_14250 [Pyrinomonadaceae bacterium]|jgi:hypothetical protein|nr:hypothetical protein [Pyrinomonadaceae bacterium]